MDENKQRRLSARLIGYAFILFVVEFVRGAYLLSYLPVYAGNVLHYPVTVVGLAISIHYVVDMIVKGLAGLLLDRFPARVIVGGGMFFSLIGLILLQGPHNVFIFLLSAALFGVGISPIWLVCLSRVTAEQRAFQMGVLYTVWLTGLGAGPVVINFVLDYSLSVTYFILLGLWVLGCLLSMGMGGRAEGTRRKTVTWKVQAGVLKKQLGAAKPLLPPMMLQTLAAGLLVPVLPGFASGVMGLQYAQYSMVLLAGGLCTVICLMPMGKLSDRFGLRGFLILGFAFLAAALYAMTFIKELEFALLTAALLGVSYACVLPAWNALMALYVPKGHQEMGWGTLSSVEGLGAFIGPVLGGWLADRYGEVFVISASAVLLGAIALWYILVPLQPAVKTDGKTAVKGVTYRG
ncbi:MFS transporter [Paenibacillus chitinolyticus]|uniref:MFS transporter n=1 Tax=Paenibacillus chitinolyticus TaxID=79263 RepID=UPI002DBFC01A|nr:MFS transporter [Paenibacillus chitinolyticus]MEC0248009.1 MFS transporter [Paenibacillus chitinolyticus]